MSDTARFLEAVLGNKRSQLFDEEQHDNSNISNQNSNSQKKVGRKPIKSEAGNKRAAQNRAAQRAFRDRKQKYVIDLEMEINQLKTSKEAIAKEVEQLRSELSSVKKENDLYKKVLDSSAISSTFNFKVPIEDTSIKKDSSLESIEKIIPSDNYLFSPLKFSPSDKTSTLSSTHNGASQTSSSQTTPVDISLHDISKDLLITSEIKKNFSNVDECLENTEKCLESMIDSYGKPTDHSNIDTAKAKINMNATFPIFNQNIQNFSSTISLNPPGSVESTNTAYSPFSAANNKSPGSEFNIGLKDDNIFSSLQNLNYNDPQLFSQFNFDKNLNHTSTTQNLPKFSDHNILLPSSSPHIKSEPDAYNSSINFLANTPDAALFTTSSTDNTNNPLANSHLGLPSKSHSTQGSLYSYLESLNSIRATEITNHIDTHLPSNAQTFSTEASNSKYVSPLWKPTTAASSVNTPGLTNSLAPFSSEINYLDASLDALEDNNTPQNGTLKNHELDELCELLRINAKCSNELKIFCSEWENLKSETAESVLLSSIKSSDKMSFGI